MGAQKWSFFPLENQHFWKNGYLYRCLSAHFASDAQTPKYVYNAGGARVKTGCAQTPRPYDDVDSRCAQKSTRGDLSEKLDLPAGMRSGASSVTRRVVLGLHKPAFWLHKPAFWISRRHHLACCKFSCGCENSRICRGKNSSFSGGKNSSFSRGKNSSF